MKFFHLINLGEEGDSWDVMAYVDVVLIEARPERTGSIVHVVAQHNATPVVKDTSQPVSIVMSQLLILFVQKGFADFQKVTIKN